MATFPVHTFEAAPERSKPALRQLQSAFGMIPNIAGAMATSPVLINTGSITKTPLEAAFQAHAWQG